MKYWHNEILPYIPSTSANLLCNQFFFISFLHLKDGWWLPLALCVILTTLCGVTTTSWPGDNDYSSSPLPKRNDTVSLASPYSPDTVRESFPENSISCLTSVMSTLSDTASKIASFRGFRDFWKSPIFFWSSLNFSNISFVIGVPAFPSSTMYITPFLWLIQVWTIQNTCHTCSTVKF